MGDENRRTIRFEISEETRFQMKRAKADYQIDTHAELFERLLDDAGYGVDGE